MALRDPDDNAAATAPPPAFEQPAGGFPRDPAEFDSDPRISFSKIDNKFILETEDGQEFEFDTALKRWIPKVGSQAFSLRKTAPLPPRFLIEDGFFQCSLG